jgi:hypothetical protein
LIEQFAGRGPDIEWFEEDPDFEDLEEEELL